MKKKLSITMEDHRFRNLDGESNRDYEIASILLELSHPVVFSSDSLFLPKWGRTKKRSTSAILKPPKISPESVIESLPSTDVTSSSSCLTGEAKKTNIPQTINKGFEEKNSTKNQRLNPKISSCSVLEVESLETSLIRAHVALVGQPIDDQNLRHLQPLICFDRMANVRDIETAPLLRQAMDNLDRRGFDLNLPATEECNRIAAVEGFQRVATKVKAVAAAQARQRRLALMRSKKLYSSRFISSYQFNQG